MARPQKTTVEFFSHDSTASQGRTLSVLYNHFGHEGISAWWLLLEVLARTRGHSVTFQNGEDSEFLAAQMHFKPERLKEILAKMATLGAIDAELFSTGLIWCQNFVDRLETVYKFRKQPLPIKPELLNTETKFLASETELLATETPQRERESKVKRVKRESSTAPKKQFGEFKNVLLTDRDYELLVKRFTEPIAKEWIETLSSGKATNRKYKYDNDRAAILQWERMDKKREAANVGTKKGMPGNQPAGAFADLINAANGSQG